MAVQTAEEIRRVAYAGEFDGILGAAAELLVQDGNLQAAALVLDVRKLDFVNWEENYHEYYDARIDVDHYMIERFTDEVRAAILEALREANRDQQWITDLVVRRAILDSEGWRGRVEAVLAGTPRNNAVLAPVRNTHLRKDGMLFRDRAELSVYEGLKRAQEQAAPGEGLLIVPNPGIRLKGASREVDILVIHRGRCAGIEVDGSSHYNKWSSDRSKDQAFQKSGIAFVERIDVQDAENHAEVDTFVQGFLVRLGAW